MQTEKNTKNKPCNCRRGMVIIFALFFMAVSVSVYALVSLYYSIG